MPHGDHELDFDAEMNKGLPDPYCQTPWRQMAGTMGFTATIVLGMSVYSHFTVQAGDLSTLQQASAAAPAPSGAASAAATAQVTGSAARGSATVPVAQGFASDVNSQASFKLVATQHRTTFNVAARSIRPSVLGIRASFGAAVPGERSVERVGSGVIVHPSGYVITNFHVVSGASSIVVSRFRQPDALLAAQLVAVEDDLALLKVADGGPFPAAQLADSSQTRVGDWVLAVGHPFGLGLTVTAGIVGQRRGELTIPGGKQYTGLIQTDAPINEGSSGGPLVDLNGQVVGVNTAIYAPTGVFSGAGFAIPSNRVRAFLQRSLPATGGPLLGRIRG